MQSGSEQYTIRICDHLLESLNIAGIDPSSSLVFFAEQVESMINVDPNFKPDGRFLNKRRTKSSFPCWIMRGYYPEVPIFFKITLIYKKDCFHYCDTPYYAKITMPMRRLFKFTRIDSKTLRPYLVETKADQMLLGASAPLKQYEFAPKIDNPRCMSPKDIPIHSLKKTKCHSIKSRSKKL